MIGGNCRHIHAQFVAEQSFTLVSLTDILTAAIIIPDGTTNASLWRLLHKNSDSGIGLQGKFLCRHGIHGYRVQQNTCPADLKRHREENRMVEYLHVDETWFTNGVSHSMERVESMQPVTSATDSRQVPPADGERFMVVAAGTGNSFIKGSLLSFPAKNTTGDYHGKMNSELFIRWLTSQLLPTLEQPAAVVMDNAQHHS